MGRKGSRYSIDEKLHFIGLLKNGRSANSIEREFGIKATTISHWNYLFHHGGIVALKPKHTCKSYTIELKEQVVQEYLAGGISMPQLCDKFEVSNPGVIFQWLSRYTSGKSLVSARRNLAMKNGRKTTQLERIEIAEWVIANDMDYTGATKQYDISYGQVYAWVKKFKQGGPEALVDRRGKAKSDDGHLSANERQSLEIKRLKARLEYVSTENALLKKFAELERSERSHRKHT